MPDVKDLAELPRGLTSEVVDQAGQQPASMRSMRLQIEGSSGPLPPPALMIEYAKVIPGLERKFVGEWEREAEFRRDSIARDLAIRENFDAKSFEQAERQQQLMRDELALKADHLRRSLERDNRAQWMVFGLGGAGLGLAGYLAAHGHDVGSVSTTVATVGTVVAAMFRSKWNKTP